MVKLTFRTTISGALCRSFLSHSSAHLLPRYRQLKAKGPAALSPQAWVAKVADEYTSFLANAIVPLARQLGKTVYIAGVTPPVVGDRCTLLAFPFFRLREGQIAEVDDFLFVQTSN
jgi:hypothetical protein